jgi:hypothetical protein
MDVLPSSEFRKTFARLTEATTVTVNGHPIGEWVPLSAAQETEAQNFERRIHDGLRGFNSRPFTPVPKVRRRG